MPPQPKRKTAKARQRKGRSHLHFSSPPSQICPQCHRLKLSHSVCPYCGSYKGKKVIEPKITKK